MVHFVGYMRSNVNSKLINSFSKKISSFIHSLHIIYIGGVSEEEKHKRELETMDQISKMLGPLMGGDEMLSLWKEYEACTTEEAKLLKDLDKIEMILQAQEYEAEGSNGQSLDEFFTSTEGKWRTEIGKAWAEEIVSRRKKPTDEK